MVPVFTYLGEKISKSVMAPKKYEIDINFEESELCKDTSTKRVIKKKKNQIYFKNFLC